MIGSAQAFKIGSEFAAAGAAFATQSAAKTAHYGALLQTRVRANASGRPGPRVITGNYRSSIGLSLSTSGAVSKAVVGTNAPQGRRLELGFADTDSLGRAYNQPPFAHFGPAFDEIKDDYAQAIGGLVHL